MAQYGDQYGHVKNHEFDSQAVHGNTDVNMEERDIVTHEGSNGEQQHQEKLPISSGGGDGGVRNKKGLTEKIMEKIPGVDPKESKSHHTTTNDASTNIPGGESEKKGMLDKIKENISSVGPKNKQSSDTGDTTTATNFNATTMPGGKGKPIEDDKLIDKLKEKLP